MGLLMSCLKLACPLAKNRGRELSFFFSLRILGINAVKVKEELFKMMKDAGILKNGHRVSMNKFMVEIKKNYV